MNLLFAAVLVFAQIGQIPICSVPEHGWDSTCGAMMKFCRLYPRQLRPQDLMPLVEPLPPRGIAIHNCIDEPDASGCGWPSPILNGVTVPAWPMPQEGYALPSVVPAIQEEYVEWKEQGKCHAVGQYFMSCDTIDHKKKHWTCADHKRVLLSSEDGSGHWCVRF